MSHPHHPTLLHNRLPYFGRTGLVRNGLVAEYRFDESKNLLKYSQQFDNAAWGKERSSVTANATTAPDGTTTADKLIEDGTASNTHQTYHTNIIASSPNVFSVHVKAAERSHVWLVSYNGTDGIDGVGFDLSAGTVGSASGQATGKIQSLGDGWYRCIINCTYTLGKTTYFYIRSAIGASSIGDSSYSGDGTSGIYIWGAQLEAGSVARTYYPTTDKQLLMDYSRPRKNLLLPNQANCCEDGTTTGSVSLLSATISAEPTGTTAAWQGSYSCKVVTPNSATAEGLSHDTIYELKPSTTYTGSMYLKGSGTVKLSLTEYTDAESVVGSEYSESTITLTDAWTRYAISRTFGTTGRGARLRVITASKQAATFYVDGRQLEEGSTATAWEAPPNIGICGSTTGADTNDPTYTGEGASFTTDDRIAVGTITDATGSVQSLRSMTVVFYTPNEINKSSTGEYILMWNSIDSKGLLALGSVTSLLTDEYITVAAGISKRCGVCGDGSIPAGWHMLTINQNAAGWYDIILDGVSLTISTNGTSPAAQEMNTVMIGATYTAPSSYLNGVIAHIMIYSRALTQAEITQNYNYLKSYLLRERGIALA